MNEYKKRLEELEKLLGVECEKYEENCSRCPYRAECGEYSQILQEIKK